MDVKHRPGLGLQSTNNYKSTQALSHMVRTAKKPSNGSYGLCANSLMIKTAGIKGHNFDAAQDYNQALTNHTMCKCHCSHSGVTTWTKPDATQETLISKQFLIWHIWDLTKQLWIPVPIALAVLAQLGGLYWFFIKRAVEPFLDHYNQQPQSLASFIPQSSKAGSTNLTIELDR
ncbi:hypothetical protein C8R45DRAFT_944129 [Mycena sanguinolenta]|nr:hypothetical protein C8R45DRAFT_944129 [Mycena sanguinolenta]